MKLKIPVIRQIYKNRCVIKSFLTHDTFCQAFGARCFFITMLLLDQFANCRTSLTRCNFCAKDMVVFLLQMSIWMVPENLHIRIMKCVAMSSSIISESHSFKSATLSLTLTTC